MTTDEPKCELCGEPMPEGEEMFKFHGYSGPCPKPPLPKTPEPRPAMTPERIAELRERVKNMGPWVVIHAGGYAEIATLSGALEYAKRLDGKVWERLGSDAARQVAIIEEQDKAIATLTAQLRAAEEERDRLKMALGDKCPKCSTESRGLGERLVKLLLEPDHETRIIQVYRGLGIAHCASLHSPHQLLARSLGESRHAALEKLVEQLEGR